MQKQVRNAARRTDCSQAICIFLKSVFPQAREFVMTYDVQKGEIKGIVEKTGRHSKRLVRLCDIMR